MKSLEEIQNEFNSILNSVVSVIIKDKQFEAIRIIYINEYLDIQTRYAGNQAMERRLELHDKMLGIDLIDAIENSVKLKMENKS